MFATFDHVRLRYLTLKLRALCWVLRRLRAGNAARAEAPDLETARSGAAPRQEAASPASRGNNPAIANYRFRALKVPLGALMFAAGRRNLKASFRLGSLIST